jgi:N-acetylglucosamine kinase-like BadF-type ATPase
VSDFFLGIDGGGTRTRALVVDARGAEVVRLEGAATLVDPANPAESVAEVDALGRAAARELGLEVGPCVGHAPGQDPPGGGPFRAMWAGLAGAGSEPVRTQVENALLGSGLAVDVSVGTDAQAAFFDAFGDGPGILLVAGTGSVALGRGDQEEWSRVGGWGMLLGDEGSAYSLGMTGLRGVARASDGRGPPTLLESRILQTLGLGQSRELIAWVARASKRDIAALAPQVCAAAEDGDELATLLVETATEDLVGHVLTVIRTLGPWSDPPGVAMVGGLLSENRPLRARIQSELSGLSCTPLQRPVDAARGAALMAMRGAHSSTPKS